MVGCLVRSQLVRNGSPRLAPQSRGASVEPTQSSACRVSTRKISLLLREARAEECTTVTSLTSCQRHEATDGRTAMKRLRRYSSLRFRGSKKAVRTCRSGRARHVAEEIGSTESAVRTMVRNIKRVARGQTANRAKPRGAGRDWRGKARKQNAASSNAA